MDKKEVIERLNENDMFDLLQSLGGDPIMTNNAIVCRGICHGGTSHKLYYYYEKKVWKCYTHDCKIGNIFNLIMKVKDCEFIEAFHYVCDMFGFKADDNDIEESLDLNIFKRNKKEKFVYNNIKESNLNVYYPYYHQSWIDDNITIESMKKYNILFNVKQNRIIIPHYDLKGNLIGIRRRNLSKEEVDKGKYMPEIYNGEVFSHSLGNNIYGLNTKKEEDYKKRKLILFEAEKSVLQLEGYQLGLVGGALCGSSLTEGQYDIIIKLISKYELDEIIIALDKEYMEDGDELSEFYSRKIRENMVNKLLPYVDVSVIWDTKNVLDYKDSPTDKGKDVFVELFNNRLKMEDDL